MAAVTVTSGWPKPFSVGDKELLIWRITDVDDAETLDTGLGTRYISHTVSWIGNPSTQASGGGHSAYSGSTITFYPSSDNLDAEVWVLANGA